MVELEKAAAAAAPDEDDIDAMSWQHCTTEDLRHSLDGRTTATPTTQSHLASSTYHLNHLDHLNRTPPFPEGTLPGYLTVLGAFMALFCTFGQMNAFGTYQAWYAEHQLRALQPSTIAWIGSLQLWVFFLSGGPIGRLFDEYGPRWLMLAGSLIHVFSIAMTSISTRYYQYILAHGIVFGLGVGMLFYPSMSSVSTYFYKRRATALGVVASGSSCGGVMYPLALQRLFTLVGFGWGVRISALLSLVCCVVAVCTVTRYAPPKARGGGGGGGAAAASKVKETFRDARFVLLAGGSSLVALGLFIPFFFIVDYAHALSLPPTLDPLILALMNTGGVLGRIAPAYLADLLGPFNLLAPSALLSGLLCVLLWLLFARGVGGLVCFAAAYGFASGAFISVVTPCVGVISDIREIGGRIGVLYSLIAFPSLFGGPIAGKLLEAGKGDYTGLILFAGLTLIAGSVLILAAKLKIDPRLFARV